MTIVAAVAECVICNGVGQVTAGTACPVCGGTGVASAEEAAKYRAVLVAAAVDGAAAAFRTAGGQAAIGWSRELAQARRDAVETTARAGQVLEALVEARHAAQLAREAVQQARTLGDPVALAISPRSLPVTPPGAPTFPLAGGTRDPNMIVDSILVRDLEVWGNIIAPNFTALVNPMTALGDLIEGGALGVPGRLAVGAGGQVLTVVGGVPAWANSAAGFANPMTTVGDLILAGAAGAAGRLAVGAGGQVLTVVGGTAAWANSPAGFANPMTTVGDLILAGAAGAAGRLAVGIPGQVLTVVGGSAAWRTSSSGFANPMTTLGDLILGGAGGAAGRLGIGSNGQQLQVTNGAVAWAQQLGIPLAGPSPTQQTVWLQPDGSILVLPLAFYSLAGDDSTWINTAFTFLPVVAGGGTSYGGSYSGPWIMGTVRLLPADYTITTGIVMPLNSGATINLIGHGPGTRLFVGNGAVGLTSHVAMGGPQVGHPAQQTMGTYWGLRFDGGGVANGAVAGVEIGGGWGRHVDVACVNFSAPGGIGLHINNAPNAVSAEWTEKCRFSVDLLQNTIACVIENTAGNQGADSCEYNDIDLYIIATNSNVNPSAGLILRGGAFLSGGSLRIRGNFPAFSGPVLTLTGQDAASGNWSSIYHEMIDITVESNANANIPQTVNFGNNNNTLHQCVGIMSFQFTAWTPSNVSNGATQFGFKGIVDGDLALVEAVSAVTTPAVVAASTDKPNGTATDVMVYVAGGTGVAVSVDGVATGLGSGSFLVPNNGVINLGAYTVAPTWKWVGVL